MVHLEHSHAVFEVGEIDRFGQKRAALAVS
jgi:hypothetical protein